MIEFFNCVSVSRFRLIQIYISMNDVFIVCKWLVLHTLICFTFNLHSKLEKISNCIIHNPRISYLDVICTYSQLSLSRLRLSRITAYLEEKIWSLF